ncbi:MAG: T9SS type A sorting domain-containing protein, partial [Chitinophagales bacterium]
RVEYRLLAFAGLPFMVSAQTTIISDDFESYSSGALLAASSDLWTTWSGGADAEDATISNAQSTSGSNSIHVTGLATGGPTDLILPFPEDYTSGVYDFSLKMYITSGKGGYFNIQQSSTPGIAWMFEVYFDNAGGGYISAGGANAATFTYTPNSWTSIKVTANLDDDQGECFINSNSIHTWQWSLGADGSGAEKAMGGIDIFSYGGNGATPDFYIDDVVLIKAASPAIITETFESYFADELLAANSDLWTTWSGGTSGEDAYVSNAYSSSGINAVHISGSSTDLILPFPENYTTGVYDFSLKMFMTNGNGGYFNIQQNATPGIGWMFEIYFDGAGGGYINAGGNNAATVSYVPETWVTITVKMDLTNDLGEFLLNSNSIHTWQWSLGATGTGTVKAAGGIDIFASAATGSTPDFYIDDVLLTESFPTSITSSGNEPALLIAPNPSNGQFSVAINDLPVGNYQLELIDMLGRLVHSESMNASGSFIKNFDMALPDGVYFVRFNDGLNTTSKKIVIN